MAPKALGFFRRVLRPGESGEQIASRYLERRGYAILARNFRCRSGEIDLVAREAGTMVFVEVKERRGADHGSPAEAVTCAKRRRLIRAARLYAQAHGLPEGSPKRFDVVAVVWGSDGRPEIRHDPGAFDSGGS